MEIRKLEAFCKVVELKSFTRAAEAVLLSQPTVSGHIRNLENELGEKLINRLDREVETTPVGKILYGYASQILQIRQEALQAIKQYGGKLAGQIKVGCGTIPGTYILPELISQFRDEHPSIRAVLRITGSKIIAGEVLDGQLELGFVGARWEEKKLAWVEMFSDELTLALYPDHPLAGCKEITLRDVMSLPFILREPESGTRKVFSKILEGEGLKENDLDVVAEIGTTAAVKEAIKAGIGISTLSKRAVRDDVDCGRLTTVSLKGYDMYRPFYLIQRKNRDLSPVASAFVSYLTA
ncbi:MAG: LysR family transcriptional regulator [Deltaproteobacteria bacterium]|nr:LysR family transcriptional regulator [Deltaproteobacteria bacterium]